MKLLKKEWFFADFAADANQLLETGKEPKIL